MVKKIFVKEEGWGGDAIVSSNTCLPNSIAGSCNLKRGKIIFKFSFLTFCMIIDR